MQQPLERYGVVVLLFLVALVAVAVFWEDGDSTRKANESLATVEPVDEPPPSELERRPAVDGGRPAPARSAPDVVLGPEAPGADLRGRTTTYGVSGGSTIAATPPTTEPELRREPAAPVADARTSSSRSSDSRSSDSPGTDAGLSRPEARNGAPRRGEGAMANLVSPPANGRDALVRDLDRAGTAPSPRPSSLAGGGASATTGGEHVVRAGESLWRIAQRELGNGARWQEIARLNGLSDSDHITEGMRLKLPTREGVPAVAPTAKGAPAESAPRQRGTGDAQERLVLAPGTRRYVVKKGDTLGLIAQRELGTAKRADEIKRLNGMTSDVVRLGATITLPADGGADDAPVVAVVTPPQPRRAAGRPATTSRRPGADGEPFVR